MRAYNVSCGDETNLNQLYASIVSGLMKRKGKQFPEKPQYEDFRQGDIRASLADISAIKRDLGYQPLYRVAEGMEEALDWYVENLS